MPVARKQPYSTYMLYTLLADAGGFPLRDVFWNADAIVDVYRRAQADLFSPQLRAALEPSLRQPALAGISYGHVAALGCEIEHPLHGEPNARPCLSGPAGVARLRDPDDFMETPLVQRRRAVAAEIERLWGGGITVWHGAGWQGPVTTAVLLAGMDFLTWPLEYPEAAHALMRFAAESAVRYARACIPSRGGEWPPENVCIYDDFAGLFSPAQFDEFVLPYWDLYYEAMGCSTRAVHSELLRAEHLDRLPRIGITFFDPSADQYLTPELLRDHCPVPFMLRILDWHIRDNDAAGLQRMYRRLAAFEPTAVQFGIERLSEERKFLALMEVATELAGER